MKIKLLCTVSIICLSLTSFSQELHSEGEIIDARDGKVYQTVKILNTVWLAENMRFKTKKSVSIDKNDVGIDVEGYYYPYDETDDVCPAGFEIPKDSDWNEYRDYIFILKDVPKSAVEYNTTSKKKVSGIAAHISDETFSFFEEPNPLKLKISGTLQGSELLQDEAFNFWSRMDDNVDPKYHLHITKEGYGNHTHKHHIETKKDKKRRKFVVRCIKSKVD